MLDARGGPAPYVLMRVRPVTRKDVPQISRLFYETVHRVNANDYGPDRIRAWAPRIYTDAFWLRRFRGFRVLIADDNGEIVGFAALGGTGKIDCFYVHHAHLRKGIGSALLAHIRREALCSGAHELQADVSLSAEPFFRRMGFKVVRRQIRVFRNRPLKQARMEKHLRRVTPSGTGGKIESVAFETIGLGGLPRQPRP